MTPPIVQELNGMDQRAEGPGVWLLPQSRQFGVKPERSDDGRERIPFFWATEWPPLGEFALRFPGYWKADKTGEAWIGGPWNPHGIYWCMYDPSNIGRA